jgi:hypothetical protein
LSCLSDDDDDENNDDDADDNNNDTSINKQYRGQIVVSRACEMHFVETVESVGRVPSTGS